MGFVKLSEVEEGTFREQKSVIMNLHFTEPQEMYIEEGQENCKTSDCRRSFSWNYTFLVSKLIKYEGKSCFDSYNSQKSICSAAYSLLVVFLISYMASAPCCFPVLSMI